MMKEFASYLRKNGLRARDLKGTLTER
jgi:hypothetical protein